MSDIVKVFVSYSHQDAEYLDKNSLLGFLQGLEKDGVEFWTDRRIRPGELWDEVIKVNLQDAHIALVLISQAFLDSPYCQNVEIERCLARQTHLFPIILSACDWRRHAWLSSRQFLPGGDQTVEEDYTEPDRRKRLFLEIREGLRERVELIRKQESPPPDPSLSSDPLPKPPFSGKAKIAACDHLGDSWRKLADYFEITPADRARFERGDEARGIWEWLESRRRLDELPQGLIAIDRRDLVELLDMKP
ncbi:MAG: toll/interleukin-1 receptor domain-containing protein [Candidatus Contendobacter sp.]|nr:toll/interleukin-1 receptor domain-containing protein [Candidatus Contendobacter sp.]